MLLPRGGQWRLFGEVTWTNRAWKQKPSAFLAGVSFVRLASMSDNNWRKLVETRRVRPLVLARRAQHGLDQG
jgi:hypothetical protein